MNILHIANTQFEWELIQKTPTPLLPSFSIHPIFKQLQFLPLLYAKRGDGILVSDFPPLDYLHALEKVGFDLPEIHLLSTSLRKTYSLIQSWGASQMVAEWANTHHIHYDAPDWEVIKEVNSKAFSFLHSPKLPKAALLYNKSQAINWLKHSGTKIFKTCFGVAGRGHLIIDQNTPEEKIFSYLYSEWKEGRPVVAEPFVKRLLDFSTQWEIFKDTTVTFLGSTLCENELHGQYRNNQVGDESELFGKWLSHLNEHKDTALDILKKMARMGYFGNVGIDAMIYESDGAIQLHPVVEINARKTMGWVALKIRDLYFPNQQVSIQYVSSKQVKEGLLPSFLIQQNHRIEFSKQIVLKLGIP